jgi:hypothetical protein
MRGREVPTAEFDPFGSFAKDRTINAQVALPRSIVCCCSVWQGGMWADIAMSDMSGVSASIIPRIRRSAL